MKKFNGLLFTRENNSKQYSNNHYFHLDEIPNEGPRVGDKIFKGDEVLKIEKVGTTKSGKLAIYGCLNKSNKKVAVAIYRKGGKKK